MTFNGIVRKASTSQSTLLKQPEHCSFDPEQLAAVGLAVGRQVRVRRSRTNVALYTVSEDRPESVDTTVRMAQPARLRLLPADEEEEFDVTVETEVPNPSLSDKEALAQSEFVERLMDCHQTKLVVLAPHGGSIEPETDRQAERVAEILGTHRASVWLCRGFRKGGGAARQWHITSSEINDDSFPLLRSIARRGFEHAVAFHGSSGAGVLVGGGAPGPLKKRVAAEIERVLDRKKIKVRIALKSDKFNGDEPRNIVNRLTKGGIGGVQIEQSEEARNHWEAIAGAVAGVYAAG